MIIGYTIGSSTIESAIMILKQRGKIRSGNYVILEYDNSKVLGLIVSLNSSSNIINESITDPEIIEKMKQIQVPESIKEYIKAKIKIICKLTGYNFCERVDFPPPPGTPVRLATKDELQGIFNNGKIRIGTLVGSDVEVSINPNYLTRHLAILAATGSGKSNAVAVLSERIAESGGCILIFDFHGEYYDSNIKHLNVINPKLNPLHLNPREFAVLLEIRENAFKQYRVFRRAFIETKEEIGRIIKEGNFSTEELKEKFFETLKSKITTMKTSSSRDKDVKYEVESKIEDFQDRYGYIIDLLAPDIIYNIKLGMVNVVNISQLDEEAMDAIISHYLRRILDARKENKWRGTGLKYPVLIVIEEAHVFLSRDRNTLTKYWASRVSREGRKFGVGLIIVSQRPKGLDENILSQMTNKIILKIIEPSDKKYVLEASDNLSEDLVEQLSSLDIGEAIVIGKIVSIPAIVKIDKFEGKLAGSDPDLLKEWSKTREQKELGDLVSEMGELKY